MDELNDFIADEIYERRYGNLDGGQVMSNEVTEEDRHIFLPLNLKIR